MISIIIPVYNAEKNIIPLLEGLNLQTRQDFEVIIVDDGSTDDSKELAEKNKIRFNYTLSLITQPNAGPAKARNVGVENAKGDIIIFLDSDCLTPPDWIEEMVRPLIGNVAGCNSGYQTKNSESLVARYIGYEIARRHERLTKDNIDSVGSYSASFIKNIFLKAGGFNTDYRTASGEDFDLSFNIHKLGYRLVFTDATFVFHYHPDTLCKFLKQQFYRGYWRVPLYTMNTEKIYRGDSYTGFEPQLQFILSLFAVLAIPLVVLNIWFLFLPLLLLISNIPLGIWVFNRERVFIIIAPVIASMRSIAGTFGVIFYFVKRVIP
jgi:glycosyltransferase involved in cell wall biosynthesis